MQEKLISFFIGIGVGAVITLLYSYFFNNTPSQMGPGGGFGGGNMEMTDERLTQMAERLGMTKDELQKEIDAGKDIRTLMQEKGITPQSGNSSGRTQTRETQTSN
ncbi:MAG: hypothetical protein AB7E37_01315 [Candidatus Altimarinota bacterium]